MKKIIASALAASMALSMVACGGSSAPAASAPAAAAPAASAPAAAAPAQNTNLKHAFAYGDVTDDYEGLKIDCSADDEIELSIGCSGTISGTVMGDSIAYAQEQLEKWTDGKVKITLYESGQLGSDTEMLEGMQMGSVDMLSAAPSGQVSMIPNLAVLDLPAAFSNMDNANTVLGDFVNLIQADYNAQGLQLLSTYASEWRLLTSNKEYKSLADFKGTTLRVQENPYHIAFWGAMGANPTPLAFGEVYLSLQQGMLDAQENPYGTIIGAKLFEVQKYLYESDHIPFINTTIISKAKYDSLSAAQKQAVDQFVYVSESYMLDNAQAAIDEELKAVTDSGMTYIAEMPADIVAQYPVAQQSVIELLKKNVNADFLANYLAAVNAAEGSSLTV